MTSHAQAIANMRGRWFFIDAQVSIGVSRNDIQSTQVACAAKMLASVEFSIEGATAVCEELQRDSYQVDMPTNVIVIIETVTRWTIHAV